MNSYLKIVGMDESKQVQVSMNVVYNMDCMEAMRKMPDKCFDLAVCDPPYFSGPERRGYYGCKISKIGVHRDYPISPAWEIPGAQYFLELGRVSKKYIIWGCNYFDFVFPPGRVIWDKCNANSSFSDCEIAATNCHDSVRLFRFMWNGTMQEKALRRDIFSKAIKARTKSEYTQPKNPSPSTAGYSNITPNRAIKSLTRI